MLQRTVLNWGKFGYIFGHNFFVCYPIITKFSGNANEPLLHHWTLLQMMFIKYVRRNLSVRTYKWKVTSDRARGDEAIITNKIRPGNINCVFMQTPFQYSRPVSPFQSIRADANKYSYAHATLNSYSTIETRNWSAFIRRFSAIQAWARHISGLITRETFYSGASLHRTFR